MSAHIHFPLPLDFAQGGEHSRITSRQVRIRFSFAPLRLCARYFWLRLCRSSLFVVNSESQRAAAFARIGPTDESSGVGMNQDHMGAAKTFGIAADDLMASAR